jgi:RimJ/RimL family protein N-acetyltransferase
MMEHDILTVRLLIGKLKRQNAHDMFLYRSDPEVMRYQSWNPANEREVKVFIKQIDRTVFNTVNTWFQLGIYLRATRELIGDIGLHFLPPDNTQTEIGFSISPAHQRKGYATEAVKACISYLFAKLGKHRVTASVDPRNAASIRLLEKIGMRLEGHFRQSIRTETGWADDLIYALLETEWNEK